MIKIILTLLFTTTTLFAQTVEWDFTWDKYTGPADYLQLLNHDTQVVLANKISTTCTDWVGITFALDMDIMEYRFSLRAVKEGWAPAYSNILVIPNPLWGNTFKDTLPPITGFGYRVSPYKTEYKVRLTIDPDNGAFSLATEHHTHIRSIKLTLIGNGVFDTCFGIARLGTNNDEYKSKSITLPFPLYGEYLGDIDGDPTGVILEVVLWTGAVFTGEDLGVKAFYTPQVKW